MDGVVGGEDRRDEAGDGRGVKIRRRRVRYAGRLAGELRASGECIRSFVVVVVARLIVVLLLAVSCVCVTCPPDGVGLCNRMPVFLPP